MGHKPPSCPEPWKKALKSTGALQVTVAFATLSPTDEKLTLTLIYFVASTQYHISHDEVRHSISLLCPHPNYTKCKHLTATIAVAPPTQGGPRNPADAKVTVRIKSYTYTENCLLTERKKLMASLSPA